MSIIINENQLPRLCAATSLLPHFAGIKNPQLDYIGATDLTAKLVGFKNYRQMIGKSDYDLPSATSENATQFQLFDTQVFKNNVDRKAICFCKYKDGWHLLYSNYRLIKNKENKPLALSLNVNDFTEFPMLNIGLALHLVLQRKLSKKEFFFVELTPQYFPLDMTDREKEYLLLFTHGYSAKEISKILHVSFRTVEDNIAKLKALLNCHSKSELREKARHFNYFGT